MFAESTCSLRTKLCCFTAHFCVCPRFRSMRCAKTPANFPRGSESAPASSQSYFRKALPGKTEFSSYRECSGGKGAKRGGAGRHPFRRGTRDASGGSNRRTGKGFASTSWRGHPVPRGCCRHKRVTASFAVEPWESERKLRLIFRGYSVREGSGRERLLW